MPAFTDHRYQYLFISKIAVRMHHEVNETLGGPVCSQERPHSCVHVSIKRVSGPNLTEGYPK